MLAGVQCTSNDPGAGSAITAPAGPLTRVNALESPASTSVAVSGTVSIEPHGVDWLAIAATTGASLTQVMVIDTVAWSVTPLVSRTS